MCVIGACGGSAASVVDPGGGSTSSSSSGGTSGSSGGSSSGDVSIDGGGTADAKPTKDAAREANAPGCPGQYSDAPPGHCTIGLSCEYDEGTCACVDYCGGAPPPPDEDFSHWSCKKVDDCPQPKPTGGSSCKTPGQTCTYGSCCIEQFTCVGSKWSSGGVSCPP